MCYDVRHAAVILFGEGLGYWRVSGCGGGVFYMVGGVLAGLQRFYLGIQIITGVHPASS